MLSVYLFLDSSPLSDTHKHPTCCCGDGWSALSYPLTHCAFFFNVFFSSDCWSIFNVSCSVVTSLKLWDILSKPAHSLACQTIRSHTHTHTHIYYKPVLGSKTHFGLFILGRCSEDIKKKYPSNSTTIFTYHMREAGYQPLHILSLCVTVTTGECNARAIRGERDWFKYTADGATGHTHSFQHAPH